MWGGAEALGCFAEPEGGTLDEIGASWCGLNPLEDNSLSLGTTFYSCDDTP